MAHLAFNGVDIVHADQTAIAGCNTVFVLRLRGGGLLKKLQKWLPLDEEEKRIMKAFRNGGITKLHQGPSKRDRAVLARRDEDRKKDSVRQRHRRAYQVAEKVQKAIEMRSNPSRALMSARVPRKEERDSNLLYIKPRSARKSSALSLKGEEVDTNKVGWRWDQAQITKMKGEQEYLASMRERQFQGRKS